MGKHRKHHTSSWGDDDDGGAGLALNVGGGSLINPTTGGVLALNVGGGTLINPTTGRFTSLPTRTCEGARGSSGKISLLCAYVNVRASVVQKRACVAEWRSCSCNC